MKVTENSFRVKKGKGMTHIVILKELNEKLLKTTGNRIRCEKSK